MSYASLTKRVPLTLRERSKLRVRGDVLDAAALMLSEGGYRNMTLEALSQRAGVSRATLYVHFIGGRDEIVREAYARVADALHERGLALHSAAATPVDAITGLCEAVIEIANDPLARFYFIGEHEIAEVVTTVAGRASKEFERIIQDDLRLAGMTAEAAAPLSIVLLGAIRGCGIDAATQPGRSPQLLNAVRLLVSRLLEQGE